jgi:hypothetical protein
MNRIPVLVLSLLISCWPAAAADDPPAPAEVVEAVRMALHPDRTSVRDFKIEVDVPDNPPITWTGRQMRKSVGGERRILTVFTAPPSVAGFAILNTEQSRQNDTQWIYVPPVRRVRKLVHEGRYENFLGTDFSVGDFGFLSVDPAAMKVLGKQSKDGRDTWAIEETFGPGAAYSRVLTWITTDGSIPVRREYYDPGGALWKIETRQNIVNIDGTATPLVVAANDVQQGSKSTMTFDGVRYDVQLDDGLFEPARLGSAEERARDVAASP